jgi:hypothetical protein
MAEVWLERDEAEDGDLPRVCMTCGRRATDFVTRCLTYEPPGVAGAGVAGLVGLGIRAALTKRMTVVLPLCHLHQGWKLWGGIKARRMTPEGVLLKNVCPEFVEALEEYRDGGNPRGYEDDEEDVPRRRSPATAAPPPRSSSAWVWVLVGGVLLLALLVCGGFGGMFYLLLHMPRPPVGPMPPPLADGNGPAAAPLRPEHVGLVVQCPQAGFPGNVPWTGLAVLAKGPPRFLADAELDKLLAEIRSDNPFTIGDAAKRLAQADASEQRRREVAVALEALLANPFPDVREAGARALGVWATPESVPALLKMLDAEPFPNTRDAVLEALAALKDPRAAEPVARRLTDPFSHDKARETLVALGPATEKAVIPYLTNADRQARIDACQVLAAVGTKNSTNALQAAAQDRDPGVAQAAQQALAAIAARP